MILDTLAMLIEVKGGKATIKEIQGVEDALDGAEKAATKTDKSNKTAEKGFMSLRSSIMKTIAPLVSFGVVINRTIDFAKQGENLLFMANSAGIAADKFSSLALAAEKLGGSRQGMAGVMSEISGGLMGIRRGEENALTNAAMYYGLSLGGRSGLANPEEMLFNIARSMEGKTAMEQADLGRMLGLDAGTLRLVQQGVAGVRRELELANRYNPFKDKETMRDINNFNYSLREMKLAFGMLAGEMFKSLLPHFERWAEVSKGAIDYLLEHTDALKLAFVALGGVILAAVGPWALLAGLIGLVIDDFITFKNGGESVLKPLWEGVDILLGKLKDLHAWFKENGKELWNNIKGGIKNPVGTVMKKAKNTDWQGVAGKLSSMGPLGALAAAAGNVFNTSAYFTINGGDPQRVTNAVAKGMEQAGYQGAVDEISAAQEV